MNEDDPPFGLLLEWTLGAEMEDHIQGLARLSIALFELADEAPPELATKLRELAAAASKQCDDLNHLQMTGAFQPHEIEPQQ